MVYLLFGLVIHYPMNGQNPHPSLPWAKTGMSLKLQPTIDYCLHKNRTIDLFGLHFPLLREMKYKSMDFMNTIKECEIFGMNNLENHFLVSITIDF